MKEYWWNLVMSMIIWQICPHYHANQENSSILFHRNPDFISHHIKAIDPPIQKGECLCSTIWYIEITRSFVNYCMANATVVEKTILESSRKLGIGWYWYRYPYRQHYFTYQQYQYRQSDTADTCCSYLKALQSARSSILVSAPSMGSIGGIGKGQYGLICVSAKIWYLPIPTENTLPYHCLST